MNQSMQRSRTGIPGLDDVLHGGLIPQQLYLVDGIPGAGKTTFALQYLLEGARNGEKCTYVTLSETRRELEAGALSHGWSLDGIEIIELIANEEELRGEEQLTMLPLFFPADRSKLSRDTQSRAASSKVLARSCRNRFRLGVMPSSRH